MAWTQGIRNRGAIPVSTLQQFTPFFSRFFFKSTPYIAKVGIPEFLNGIGKGVESHVAKLESEIGDFQNLLVTRNLKLKKLGIPCKHRKLILKHTHKYRLGLWRPRAEPITSVVSYKLSFVRPNPRCLAAAIVLHGSSSNFCLLI